MSLDWEFRNKEVWEALPKTDKESAVTDAIIWGTMSVGLGSIKEANIDTWIKRCHILDKIGSPIGQRAEEDGIVSWSPTREDLEKRIGLVTNATNRTDAEFKKVIFRRLEDYAKQQME